MRTAKTHRVIILASFCFIVVWTSLSYAANTPKTNVLILNSYHRTFHWTDKIIRGVLSVLDTEGTDIETYIEDMDTKRFAGKRYVQQFKNLLRLKYCHIKFGVIISSDDNAFHFLLTSHDDLFPDTPVVFCGVNSFEDTMLSGHELFTGVVETTDIKSNINLILKLHPKTKSIVVITDNTPTGEMTRKALALLKSDYSDTKIVSLDGSKIARTQMYRKLESLPENIPVLLLNFHRDKSNRFIPYAEFLPKLCAAIKSPVYCASDNFLGYGVAGGRLNSGFRQGETAGKMAKLILQGKNAIDIPVIKAAPSPYMFDYNTMKRFNIKRSDLPRESIVINKPGSFYEDHKIVFWTTLAIIFSLILFIAMLLINIRARKRLEQALKKSEYKIRSILDNATIHIWAFGGKKFLYLSREWYRYTGQDPSQTLTIERWTKLVHPDDRKKTVKFWEQAWKEKSVFDHYFRLRNVQGDYRWMYCHAVPVLDENGEFTYFSGFNIDIHERRQAEKAKTTNLQALERSEKRYRNLFDGAPVMYVIATKNQKGFPVISDCNQLFLTLLGVQRKNVIGKPLAVFYTGQSQKSMMRDVTYKRDMEDLYALSERELTASDGRIIHTLLQAVPEYDEQGNITGTRIMFVDISVQKRAEEQLKENQDLLQMIVDGISDPLIMVDRDVNVLMHNMAAMKYYGIDYQKNCLSKKCHLVYTGSPHPCKGCTIPLVVSNLEHATFERKGFMDPEHLEKITIYPVKDQHQGWAAIIRVSDITRQKQMEKELVQADKMISLGILVSGVAHEINNPNNFIMMNTSILQEAWESIVILLENYYKKTGDFILAGLPYSEMRNEVPLLFKGVIDGAERIKQIVEDLKDYARQNGTDMDQSVNINTGLKKAVRLTGDLIKKSTGNFKVEYGCNLPLIKGNEQKLQQVFINLIQNACQSLPDKEKGFFITSSFDKAGQTIVIDMQDEGHGIHENLLDRIMDPFFTTRRAEGGTGLGLSISSNILKAHGGKIEVKSKINKGTCFRIILPRNKIETPVKILVVDDESGIREFLCIELEKHKHYSVREASTGNEAFFEIGQQIPDLLILDVNMPDMNGVEVCRILKKNQKLLHIKVIIITGFPESSLVEEIVRMGFDKILSKPFRTSTFLKMVDNALETEK